MAKVNYNYNYNSYSPISLTTTGVKNSTTISGYGISNHIYDYIKKKGHTLSFGSDDIVYDCKTGTVKWSVEPSEEDRKKFSSFIRQSVDMSAEIKNGTLIRIRDRVFEELIDEAKKSGPLDHDKLTNILEGCKMMDVLSEKAYLNGDEL